jgi:hypothetical protein
VARGRKSLTIETNMDGEQVYYIRLLGGAGQPLAFTGPNITTAPGGAWRFELSPLGQPARSSSDDSVTGPPFGATVASLSLPWEEILKELGYTEEQIRALASEGAI